MADDQKEYTFFTSTPFEKDNWVDPIVATRAGQQPK